MRMECSPLKPDRHRRIFELLELIWVRAYTLLTPHMGNHLQLPYLLAHLHASNNSKKFKYGKNRLNILDLKILQVFFTNRGEILVFEKMLNFLSFLVLLYVSGHFKQKNFFFKIFLTDRKISLPKYMDKQAGKARSRTCLSRCPSRKWTLRCEIALAS